MSAEEVAVESLDALTRDQVVCIPGIRYRIIAVLVRLIPPWLLRRGYRQSRRGLD
jgi:short-subunit dehydrogenase